MRVVLSLLALLALAACQTTTEAPAPEASGPAKVTKRVVPPEAAVKTFLAVVAKVEPVAEATCRAQAPRANCNFTIVVDDRAEAPSNAFQTLDRNGRPIIGFTARLIADVRNEDEIALILGHEAAHHIEGHLLRQRDSALRGALLAGVLTGIGGGDTEEVREAQNAGAAVGARVYSKEFELEADALGTVIAYRSGYDPAVGVRFFNRIADPGNRFLGTHPPNAQRIQMVRRTLAGLKQ